MRLLRRKPVPYRAKRLYEECVKVSNQGRKYKFGGDHGKNLHSVGIHDPMDCSSSVSYALMLAGLYPYPTAMNSTWFEGYGRAGKGEWVTIYASKDHVWIKFTGIGRWWRFDTSPHGFGTSGPRMRLTPRFTTSFVARHPVGL